MHLPFTRAADFRQERDFGAKIGATFEFLRAHWRPLGKCLVYFVLPGALLMGVGLGLFTNSMWNTLGAAKENPAAVNPSAMFNASYFAGIGLAVVAGLGAFALLLGTVYAYARLLLTTEPATAPQPAQVWQELRSRLGRMLLAFGLLFGLYIALMAVFGAVAGLTAQSGSPWLVLLLVFLLLPVLFYVLVPLSLYFPVLWMEDQGVVAAVGRSFALARGRWWATAGLVLVASMIQGFLSFVFVLPQYAVMIGKMLKVPGLGSDVLGIAAQCLYSGGIIFTYTVSLVAVLFQYFHLVEQKEGLGLRSLVDSLGTGPAPVAYNQAYRPDDDGEY